MASAKLVKSAAGPAANRLGLRAQHLKKGLRIVHEDGDSVLFEEALI